MPTTALVALNVDVGYEDKVYNELLKMDEVKEIYMVYGVYDIIAVVETENLDMLRDIIVNKVRRMEGIKNTLTMIVVKRQVK